MSEALATKYRPKTFNDCCGQKSIIKILERQIETKTFKNCYLFSGPSGTGKTTIGRIFANFINNNEGSPIEIDAASNNGVDNIRNIINDAKERAIDAEYKVIILDECHMLSNQSWNALLKCIEEPPKYTLFIFCTTDPQKIPQTILNRVQRFNLTKISLDEIKERLKFICSKENFLYDEESLDYIAKISEGGMRDAIAYLDKVSSYDNNIYIDNVLEALGNYSYETFFELTNSIIDANEGKVLNIIESFYNDGKDLKLFVEQYLTFILDIDKYCIFKDIRCTKFPQTDKMIKDLNYCIGFENSGKYFNYLLDKVLEIKNNIKNDTNVKTTILILFLQIIRG